MRTNNENRQRSTRKPGSEAGRDGNYSPKPSFKRPFRNENDKPRLVKKSDKAFSNEEKEYTPNREYSRYNSERPYKRQDTKSTSRFEKTNEDDKRKRPRIVQRDNQYDAHAKYSKKKQLEYKKNFTDPSAPVRLNKFIANSGLCSRREADDYIRAGVVTVNGEIVTEMGHKILPSDRVLFHDQLVQSEKKVYLLLNKPKDCVTTTEDTHARLTVMDLVKNACSERVYPVGRLDRNTTGVLLLTNDGDLASKLTHPKYNKKKIYQVSLDKVVTKADMQKIAEGITLDDGDIRADEIQYIKEEDKKLVGIEIHSGRNRIVRRIFEELGYKVVRLDRVYFAGLTKGLTRGRWRFLNEKEINMLRMGAFE